MDDLTQSEEKREARLAEGQRVKEFARAAVAGDGEISTERSAAVEAAPNIPRPPFWGARVKTDYDLRQVFQYINETALFKNQWQLKTASQEDYLRLVQEKFRPILRDLQEEVIREGWFEPKAVYGYWPAQSEGNDVVVYDPTSLGAAVEGHGFSRAEEAVAQGSGLAAATVDRRPSTVDEVARFTFPRQREGRRLCIADFFAPKSSGQMDVIGLALVTIGHKATEITQKMFHAGEYTRYLYLHGLSVETAEALAELHHRRMREELGIAGEDAPAISDLFHQKYRGSRYSFGYPACPNMEDQTKLFALLKPEQIGVKLTAGFMLDPEQSTSAIVVHHPAAKYFVA
jgi:5-methyltetrahydrofolate--homocysteine methyltransferase